MLPWADALGQGPSRAPTLMPERPVAAHSLQEVRVAVSLGMHRQDSILPLMACTAGPRGGLRNVTHGSLKETHTAIPMACDWGLSPHTGSSSG